MAEGFSRSVPLDLANPQILHFYNQMLTMSVDFMSGNSERGKHITDHLGYLQKIFGVEVGGAIVGTALNDANMLNMAEYIR